MIKSRRLPIRGLASILAIEVDLKQSALCSKVSPRNYIQILTNRQTQMSDSDSPEVSEPTTTTLDYIDRIVVPENVFKEPNNEYWALVCLWQGLEFLNNQVLKCEASAKLSIESGEEQLFSFDSAKIDVENLVSFGRLPASIRGATTLVTMAFHWYAISACQFVRTVGAIAKRLDDSRPLPNEYAAPIIPEVIAFRDKVAAHFAWSTQNQRDNDAERLARILPPLGYVRGRISVGTMTVALKRGDTTSNSGTIKEWSLTQEHEKLKRRYLPSSDESSEPDSTSPTPAPP
jgi:hypothetical protein